MSSSFFDLFIIICLSSEKHKENFEDTAIWGPLKERVALYVLLELGLVRDYAEKRKLINPVMPGQLHSVFRTSRMFGLQFLRFCVPYFTFH